MKNYTNSDIFNSYIEIAKNKKLFSIAEEDSESSKKALEKNPRADSLTKEKIGKLYNIKNETPKNMEYKSNIMEIAHPKPAYVQDSYDKLNGLVENDIERQNINLKIVNKRTNGLLTQSKYAKNKMLVSLIKSGGDPKEINKLYNIKNEAPTGMQYKSNIMEIAHPSSSYIDDVGNKVNGLVENHIENHEAILKVVNKESKGVLSAYKKAEHNMTLSLVRLANDLDNKNEENLSKLADECLEEIKKEAGFFSFLQPFGTGTVNLFEGALRADVALAAGGLLLGAFVPALVGTGGVLAGAGMGGLAGAKIGLFLGPLISAVTSSAHSVSSLKKNCEESLIEIDDILNDKEGISKTHLDELNKFKEDVLDLIATSEEYLIISKKSVQHLQNAKQASDKSKEDGDDHSANYEAKISAKRAGLSGKSQQEITLKLSQNIQTVEEDIKLFRENFEAILAESQSDDYAGIEALQKVEKFFHPLFKNLNDVHALQAEVETLEKSIDQFKRDNNLIIEGYQAQAGNFIDSAKEAVGLKDSPPSTTQQNDQSKKEEAYIPSFSWR